MKRDEVREYMRAYHAAQRKDPEFRAKEKERQRKSRNSPVGRVKTLLRAARFRAKRRGRAFNLSIADVTPPPMRCPVLGIRLNYGPGKISDANRPSLDRRNNSKGYVKGNVFIISLRANQLKGMASPRELLAIARYANAGTRKRSSSNPPLTHH